MSTLLFDEPYYIEINEARWDLARRVIAELRAQVPGGLRSAVDVGCGPGWFSERLVGVGLEVVGAEGRPDLLAEAQRRVPAARFEHVNVESEAAMAALGTFDLAFCFGLLYHTENPFAVVRNVERVTGKVLLAESMVLPTDEPVLRLVGEGQNHTQGLTFHSVIPSRGALAKMLQTAGFSWVALYTGQVNHPDFQDSPARYPRRSIYLAARQPLEVSEFQVLPTIEAPKHDFSKPGFEYQRDSLR